MIAEQDQLSPEPSDLESVPTTNIRSAVPG